ncbi:hypothetical protein BC833DRAFT_626389 [Globomyces pollinis-pini]|nr:hypothetical protein BC833DRAFT_626389 [Globomyces pollinis-pini]
MNAVEESIVEFNGKTFKSVKFARTPIMSTYLVAICVGEYDYIEAVAHPKQPVGSDPITCRVYTLPGESQNGKFALDCCVKILEYFSEYFDCGYPLPKMDMIVIPEFSAGAMENWGLVTYRTDAFLFDEATGSIRSKTQVAFVVAHELAHQWFGNLVTMDWWDALWLNEGFATFVGTLAVDHVFPEWTAFTGFAANEMQTGLGLDGLRSSHPIEVAVNKPSDVIQIFDAISYCKGASVIRMLQSHIGAETFANGVKLYLQRHKFSNATTDDLWNALGEVAGIDVASMMEPWLHQMGYPLVSIEHEEYDEDTQELTLTISQKRYLSSGDLTEEEDASINPWHIPITIITDSFSPTKHMLTKKTDTISFPYVKTNSSFFKLNFGVTGFYRVLYNFDQLSAIGAAMKDNLKAFPIEDRLNIVSETFNFARAGLIGTDAALEILQAFESEDSQEVLTEIATRLDLVIDAFYKDETVLQEIQKLMRSIFSPKVSSVGYEYPEGEDYNNILKRNLIIKQAAKANDGNVLAELRKMFDDYFSDAKTPIHANLVPIVLTNALKHSESPESDFDKVLEFYKTTTDAKLKSDTLYSLGAINDVSIIARYIDTILLDTSIVLKQDLAYAVVGLVSASTQRLFVSEKIWEWITTNWPELFAEYTQGISAGRFGDIFTACFSKSIDPATVERVEAFIRGDHLGSDEEKTKHKLDVNKIERKANQGLEAMKGTISWVERDSQKVHDWVLNNNSYLFN